MDTFCTGTNLEILLQYLKTLFINLHLFGVCFDSLFWSMKETKITSWVAEFHWVQVWIVIWCPHIPQMFWWTIEAIYHLDEPIYQPSCIQFKLSNADICLAEPIFWGLEILGHLSLDSEFHVFFNISKCYSDIIDMHIIIHRQLFTKISCDWYVQELTISFNSKQRISLNVRGSS